MTRLLALVTDGFGGRGGIARYNCDFLSALAGAGWQITVVARYAPDPQTPPPGITQYPSRAGRLSYALRVCFDVLRQRPQVVFCGHLFMAPLGFVAARLAGARLVIQTHGIEAWQRPGALIGASCARAHLILSVSRYTRARVLSWARLAPERVRVLPDTFDASFAPAAADPQKNADLDGKKVLLTVGRLDRREAYKGHDRVIAALPTLIAHGTDVHYLVAGEGDDRPRLEALAFHHGVAERVRFVGAVSKETLIELYRRADLFVMPSTGEGFGIAFIEAMACGTPALGLSVGGACDALGDGELGIMVAPDEDLAARIAAQLRAPGLTGAPLSAAVGARFGPDQFAAQARLLLERLAAEDGHRAMGKIEGHGGR
jgi:phosphatidylinositol alpha-1,6-mannosyltransferase